MADIGTIEKAMRQIAPPHLAEEWDNCGFQIRCDSDQNIEKILVCLEISDDIITEAIQKSADLIVTHHPLIFGGIRSVDMDDMTGRYVLRLIRAGISVYSAHTSFDSAKDGTNSIGRMPRTGRNFASGAGGRRGKRNGTCRCLSPAASFFRIRFAAERRMRR